MSAGVRPVPRTGAPPKGVTRGRKLFGRYEGVPRNADLVHFPDKLTKVPVAYSRLTSRDPFTFTHYAAGSAQVLFASSLSIELIEMEGR